MEGFTSAKAQGESLVCVCLGLHRVGQSKRYEVIQERLLPALQDVVTTGM